ncbi:MAG: hypothetical protein COA32_14890 [Fluviicola sp.]|nr:MAG: hypothetical protein COA32_14890 [Fluviicola sp.]
MGCQRLIYHQKYTSKTESTPIFEMGKKQGSDYQVYGMLMDGRSGSTPEYRYGFQGQEKDDEVKGEGNSINYKYRMHDPRIGRFFAVDPLAAKFPAWSPYVAFADNPIIYIDPDGRAPQDFVQKEDGTIYWDNNANDQATTKEGETYLGKTLTFDFVSYIDEELWDGPLGDIPTGDKLITQIILTASENESGEITGVTGEYSSVPGSTPVGSARDYYPGEGGDVDYALITNKIDDEGNWLGFNFEFENHASVNRFEESGLNAFGYKIVDVGQRLEATFTKSTGELKGQSYTGIFPSSTLSVNNNIIMQYDQPSFVETHSADPIDVLHAPVVQYDTSYYPVTFYPRQ